MMMMSGE